MPTSFQVSREGSWEGEGDDGAGEQAQGGERDARGQDQAPLKGKHFLYKGELKCAPDWENFLGKFRQKC